MNTLLLFIKMKMNINKQGMFKKITSFSIATLSLGVTISHSYELGGILKMQTAYGTDANEYEQQEWLWDVEYNDELMGGELTAITRFRLDTVKSLNQTENQRPSTYSSINGPWVSNENGELNLRELYWEKNQNTIFWRIGKQQVVWGEADGLKVLDVINPQSYREFTLDDFDDSRIPLWIINAEIELLDDGILQLLWVADTSTHELAPESSPYALTTPRLMPNTKSVPTGVNVLITEAKAPKQSLNQSDVGFRYSNYFNGWDISVNYLYHHVDTPVISASIEGDLLYVEQDYKRSHLVGGTLSTAFNDWILRSEFAYETARYQRTESIIPGVVKSDLITSVMGLDWQGWRDQFISMQLFNFYIVDAQSDRVNRQSENLLSFLWESKFINETLTFKWLHIESLNYNDSLSELRLTYNYESNVDIYFGADIFQGDGDQLFGQFDHSDRVLIGLTLGL